MFVQIHMLQSMPPGNLNRDDTGQPKKCVFGGVTRGRISSQCLKRNIRHSAQFRDAFGDALASRTKDLPRMVGDELRQNPQLGVPADDLVRAVRMYKSPRELDAYRIAGESATIGLNKLMEGLLGGKSEQEAAGEAAREVVRRGGRIQTVGVNHGDTIGWIHRKPITGYSPDTPKIGDMVKGRSLCYLRPRNRGSLASAAIPAYCPVREHPLGLELSVPC